MSSKKRNSRSSRKRPSVVGLLFILTIAVLLGRGIGLHVGSKFGSSFHRPTFTSPPASQPKNISKPQRIEHETPTHKESETPAKPKLATAPRNPERRNATPPIARAREEPQLTQPLPKQPEKPKQPKHRPKAMPGEIAHVAAASDKVALTFDAGASSVPTPAVLSALRAAGLRVTFFITGKWAEQNPQLVKQIRQDGHEIGNHTYSHPDLRRLSDTEIREQLIKTDDIVTRITGRPCDPYFRPPYGGRDNRVIRIASEMGYTTIYWSLDSWDAFKKNITSSEVKGRVLERIQGGDIVLMHCGSQATADALPSLIQELQSRGYQIVSVSELIGR